MSLADAVRRELEGGAPRLRGSVLRAHLPVRQALVDDVLARVPGLPPGVSVVLGTGGHLQVRYGAFHANARVRSEAILRPRPEVTVELASQLVAWGLMRVSLPPFVRVEGRVVRVLLDEGPLAALAPFWPHVEALSFRPIAGGLGIDLQARVSGAPHS